jgi:hypothetical protein
MPVCLVSGLVEKQALIDWADRAILEETVPAEDLIELSLSARLPYSQVIWLLNSYQGQASYDLPLNLLFSQAGKLLEQDNSQAERIILGLRLLIEEEYLHKELKVSLSTLEGILSAYRQGELVQERLCELLAEFLAPYQKYRSLLGLSWK